MPSYDIVKDVNVRPAAHGDLEQVSALRARLWPDTPAEEHREEVRAILGGHPRSTMPLVVYVGTNPVVSHGHTVAMPNPTGVLRGLRDRGADDLEVGELVAFLQQHVG